MIEKVCKISNIGKFEKHVARGDVFFRKFTAIFSGNGYGKSTLADIFRSMVNSNEEIIEGRKTLGATRSASAEILVSGVMHNYNNGAWDKHTDHIHIYDSNFVNENVYGGNVVDHGHKRNLFRIIVGKKGVNLAQDIDEIDSKIRGINSNIKNEKQFLTGAFGKSVDIDKVCSESIPADISFQVTNKEKEIKAAQENKEVRDQKVLGAISLPMIPASLESLLGATLEEVSASAESEIETHIRKHDKKINEMWITKGLEAIKGEECPFCSQDLSGISLIQSYKSVFAQKYKELKSEIEKMRVSIKSLSLEEVKSQKSQNDYLMTFWRQYLDSDNIEIDTKAIEMKFKNLKDETSDLIKRKVENPLERIPTGESYRNMLSEYQSLKEEVDTYNLKVLDFNREVEKVKKAGGESDLVKLGKELEWLKALEKRNDADVINSVDVYHNLLASKFPLENEKKEKRAELDAHTDDIFPRYQQTINKYLANFDAGFSIVKTTGSFTGGKPSSNYQLVIKNVAFDIGDSKSPKNVASFKNTLSSGDKSTLALAFFLSSLELEDDADQRVVVFDDPFTSQDRFRRNYTRKLILKECERSKQVILLSHDEDFIKMVWDKADNSTKKSLQIVRTSGSSSIVEWDIEIESQSIPNRDHDTLVEFVRSGDGDKVDVVRAIRPWIEAWLRFRHIGFFSATDSLGTMIATIRNSTEDDEIYNLKDSLEELDEINEFSTEYQHGEDVSRIRQSLDSGELLGYVKRSVRLTGSI